MDLDLRKYQQWYKDFFTLKGGKHQFSPLVTVSAIVQSHWDLLEMFNNDFSFTKQIEIPDAITASPVENVKNIITQLQDFPAMQEYMKSFAIRPEHFCEEFIPDHINKNNKKRKIKWGKHISAFLQSKNCEPYIIDEIVKTLVSKLGTEWARNKTSNNKLFVTMSFDPRAFLMLGHYPCDINRDTNNKSCYGQGAGYESNKHLLSFHKNSFVLIGGLSDQSKYLNDVDSKYGDLLFRGWGIVNKPNIHVSNLYIKKTSDSNALKAIEIFFQQIFDKEITRYNDGCSITGVYQNKDMKCLFAKKPNAEYSNIRVILPGFWHSLGMCAKCRLLNHPSNIEKNSQCFICNNNFNVSFNKERTTVSKPSISDICLEF